MKRFLPIVLAVAAMAIGLFVRPADGATQQFQWFDNVLYHTSSSYATPTESAATPANWTSPVNYAGGTVFVRFQVLEKPTSYGLDMQMCVWRHGARRFQYEACSKVSPTRITDEGVYWVNFGRPNDWWEMNNNWSWAQDIDVVRFMLKDPANGKLVQSSSCGAYCHPSSTFGNNNTPIKIDGSAVVVAPGATLQPPSSKWAACPKAWSASCGGGGSIVTSSTTSTTVRTSTTTTSTTSTTQPSGGSDAAFVVGNAGALPAKDVATRDRLKSLGKVVKLVDDDNLGSSAAVSGAELVVLSSSVVPGKVPSWLATHAAPVLNLEAYAQQTLRLATSGGEIDDRTTLRMAVASTDPLAAGRSGDVVVQASVPMGVGTPVSSAKVVARIPGSTSASIYAIEAGRALTTGTAAARRVSFFTSYDSPPVLTTNGWALFDAAVRWLD